MVGEIKINRQQQQKQQQTDGTAATGNPAPALGRLGRSRLVPAPTTPERQAPADEQMASAIAMATPP